MGFAARQGFLLFPLLLALHAQAQRPAGSELERVREELGIGHFEAPSIDRAADQLAALAPIPFDKLWRPLPDPMPQDRPRMALIAGRLIADGYLAVAVERRAKLEQVGRELMRIAKGLGIGERLTKRGRHVLEMAESEKWTEIRRELTKTQGEAEAALLGLRDEDLVHLIALGGWIRGLEITTGAVVENYTPERASHLVTPALADSLLAQTHAFRPHLRNSPLMLALDRSLRAIREVDESHGKDQPFTLQEVKRLHELSREGDRAMTVPPE